MSEMKERLEKQETEGKDVKAEQEMWKGKEAELVAQLEEAERTMQSLRLSLSESECMRIALEEKCKVMDSAHSELLLSVEMFRKKNEAEMYKLKAELAASQHSLKALRHTFGLA
jgi:peptidoglycan hydrolase CwlO-like protein